MRRLLSTLILCCFLISGAWADPQETLKKSSQEMLQVLVDLCASQLRLAESGLSEALQGGTHADSVASMASQAVASYGEKCSSFESASRDSRITAENRRLATQLWQLCAAGEAHAEAFFSVVDGHVAGQPFDRAKKARYDSATAALKRELAKHGHKAP